MGYGMEGKLMESVEKNWGITGTRHAITSAQWRWLQAMMDSSGLHELHHGACTGADEQAHFCAVLAHVPLIYVHPPVNQRFMSTQVFITPSDERTTVHFRPAKSYHERNHDIVDETERLLALPDGPERLHSGTWSTIRYARSRRKRIDICYPDGLVRTEEYPEEP